jgi:cobalt-zinc-cadmium efflux system outer membrane protein
MKMNKLVGLFLCVSPLFYAQQVKSLQDCEDAFRNNNLQLLAQEYNISQADAEIIQAKIWNLPQFGFSTNAYYPEKGKFFHIGQSNNASISQLFLLGGKRQKQIDFAKSSKELAQLQYRQLSVDLKSQLVETYYALYFDQKKIVSLKNQLQYLSDLLKAYKVQTAKGNVSLKDEVRLNSLVIGLSNDIIQLNNNIISERNALMLLTGIDEPIEANIAEVQVENSLNFQPLVSLDELKNKILESNADYLFSLKSIENSKQNEAWQKSLNTPDITGGLQWSQNTGFFKNEADFTIGIPIPLWKQNEGNVKKAQFQTQQNEKNTAFKQRTLQSQLSSAYFTWKNQYDQLQAIPQKDMDNLDLVYKGMTDNFRKGNVTLIEFTDFTESYKQTVLQVNEIKKQILISAEEINRLVQTPIF